MYESTIMPKEIRSYDATVYRHFFEFSLHTAYKVIDCVPREKTATAFFLPNGDDLG